MLYESYQEFLKPKAIANAEIALMVAFLATAVSSGLLIYKRRAAKKYASLALKTDANNSIKDVLTSITAFAGIALSQILQHRSDRRHCRNNYLIIRFHDGVYNNERSLFGSDGCL